MLLWFIQRRQQQKSQSAIEFVCHVYFILHSELMILMRLLYGIIIFTSIKYWYVYFIFVAPRLHATLKLFDDGSNTHIITFYSWNVENMYANVVKLIKVLSTYLSVGLFLTISFFSPRFSLTVSVYFSSNFSWFSREKTWNIFCRRSHALTQIGETFTFTKKKNQFTLRIQTFFRVFLR